MSSKIHQTLENCKAFKAGTFQQVYQQNHQKVILLYFSALMYCHTCRYLIIIETT